MVAGCQLTFDRRTLWNSRWFQLTCLFANLNECAAAKMSIYQSIFICMTPINNTSQLMTLSKISRSKPYPFPSRQEKKNLLRGRHFGTESDSMVGGHLPRLFGLVFFWGGVVPSRSRSDRSYSCRSFLPQSPRKVHQRERTALASLSMPLHKLT